MVYPIATCSCRAFQSSNPSWSQSQWIVLRSSSCHKCFLTKDWKGLETNTGMWINICFSLFKTFIAMVAEKVDRQQTMQTIGVIYMVHIWFGRGIYFCCVQVVSTDNYEHLIRAAQLAFAEKFRKHSKHLVYELLARRLKLEGVKLKSPMRNLSTPGKFVRHIGTCFVVIDG